MKRILKIIFIGIILGIFLVMIQNIFQIDEDTFLHIYWIFAVVFVVGAVCINVFYNLFYQQKMRKIAALLDAGKLNEYITEIEKLLQNAKGKNLRNILKLNLSAGYIEAKQYDIAINILEELSSQHLSGSTIQMVHRLNLCMSYFYTAQYEKAMKLYQESQKIFHSHRNSKVYGGNVIVVDILAEIQNEQFESAKKLLNTARKSWKNHRLQAAFQELDQFILTAENNSKENKN